MAFIVGLHVAAIVAVNSGLHIGDAPPAAQGSQVKPIFEKPRTLPPPMPPVEAKVPQELTFNIPLPQTPVIETATAASNSTLTAPVEQATEPLRGESGVAVTLARIDPAHPLKQPAYPPASRRAGEEGRVELMLYILANGRVGEARIAQSSGHPRLDESALREAVRSWRFLPQQENGMTVPAWQRFAITFRLQN